MERMPHWVLLQDKNPPGFKRLLPWNTDTPPQVNQVFTDLPGLMDSGGVTVLRVVSDEGGIRLIQFLKFVDEFTGSRFLATLANLM